MASNPSALCQPNMVLLLLSKIDCRDSSVSRLNAKREGVYDQIFRWAINYASYSSASLLSLVKEIEWDSKNETIRDDETRNIKIVKVSETLIFQTNCRIVWFI